MAFITGVKNITALGNLISWQKVEYDFRFHRQDFLSNVSVLILSEAKSILPVSVNVSTVRGEMAEIQNNLLVKVKFQKTFLKWILCNFVEIDQTTYSLKTYVYMY